MGFAVSGKTETVRWLPVRAIFSSNSCEWSTPQEFFDKYNDVYHFDTDVCASSENAKCSHCYDMASDGLSQEWTGVC